MKIHIWQAYDPKKISVDLKENLKNSIKHLIKNKIYKIARQIRITPARLYDYFIYQKAPIPLNVLMRLSSLFNIPLSKIEKNIIIYKHMFVPNKNSIKNPRLPIEINPYFTSLIAHLFFDGSVPKDGKGTYYNQKNEVIMNDFINKIKEIFGEVQFTLRKDHRGVLKCSVPRIIGEMCKLIYSIEDFGTFNSRIPNKVLNLSKEHKEAFILTALIDEGAITYDGQVWFGICNKLFCEDVMNLCNNIGLDTTKVSQKSKSNFHYFYIKSKNKLLRIINSINKKYPFISLRYKEQRLRHYFETKKYPGVRTKEGGDLRKIRILESLRKGSESVNQLSVNLLIPPRSLRRHLAFLTNKGKTEKTKIGKEYFYSLTPH